MIHFLWRDFGIEMHQSVAVSGHFLQFIRGEFFIYNTELAQLLRQPLCRL